MIRHRATREVLEDLRFALEVMEENAHFGLDDREAQVLRGRILSQIEKMKAHIACESVHDSTLLVAEYE